MIRGRSGSNLVKKPLNVSCGYDRLSRDGFTMLKCEVTGKQRHASRSRAKQHAKHLKRRGSTGVHPYLCRYCGDYHVGHSGG